MAPESSPPTELRGDRRRQAVPSILGTVYQAWASIEAWLRLSSADDVIFLEGAEDFDVVGSGDAIAVQVKHRRDAISLGNQVARDALENFWKHATADPTRRVQMHYLTTSSVAVEQDANFEGLAGIEAWRAARTNADIAERLAGYLREKLPATSTLGLFLGSAAVNELQELLYGRFHWLTDRPDIEAIKRSVLERIVVRLVESGRPPSLAKQVSVQLESRFWEVVVQQPSSERRLTLGDLLQRFEDATTTNLPVPLHLVPHLLAGLRPGNALLDLLLAKPISPPEPLLHRPELEERVLALVRNRQAVLLTGTVYKGKTTTAQLVTTQVCPSAWWVPLTGRSPEQVDTLLMALAVRVEDEACPAVVVVDDLDISVGAIAVFGSSLELLIHRIRTFGRAMLVTARGTPTDAEPLPSFNGVEAISVPELGEKEVEALCLELGCPAEAASGWSKSVAFWTGGHPKLVQVRIAELQRRNWPDLRVEDFVTASEAVTSAKQLARRLLTQRESEPVIEFLYMAADLAVPMDRRLALLLADSVQGLRTAGDVVDRLTGQWLEQLPGGLLRPTTLLRGSAAEVWPRHRLESMHTRLHDVIVRKGTLNQREAAALFFHAFLSRDKPRLATTASRLMLVDRDVQNYIFEELPWLPVVALEPGQTFTDDPFADSAIRGLQFRAAAVLDEARLDAIAERWIETVPRVAIEEPRVLCETLLWSCIGMCESVNLNLRLRLSAIAGAYALAASGKTPSGVAKEMRFDIPGFPESAPAAQVLMVLATRSVRRLKDLDVLIGWLDDEASPAIRADFDFVLSWPGVQSLGAFVQGAWVACLEETEDWTPWLEAFYRIETCAKRLGLPNFGREGAKARAIVLTEYLGRSNDALAAIQEAQDVFGQSVVLTEQRANVLFQRKDDEGVLRVWEELRVRPGGEAILDPFAYRRIAMSAARLRRYLQSADVFQDGVRSIADPEFPHTKFGLLVDTALALALDGRYTEASRALGRAVSRLPAEAKEDGDVRWEAVQRAASEVCRQIEALRKGQTPREAVAPGFASSPDLKTPNPQPRQRMRSDLLLVIVVCLAASLGVKSDEVLESEAKRLVSASDIPYVRLLAAQVQVAISMRDGQVEGFLAALVDFDRSAARLTAGPRERLLEPDGGQLEMLPTAPERWLGLIAAALCCSARTPMETLEAWLGQSPSVTGRDSSLATLLATAVSDLQGFEPTRDTFRRVAATSPLARCAAALALLDAGQPPRVTLALQSFLVSAAVSDASYGFQDLFNSPIAARFAPSWLAHTQAPFRLVNPRHTSPELQRVCHQIGDRGATLRALLLAASAATGEGLGEFMNRVW